jgi:hypothetical protein
MRMNLRVGIVGALAMLLAVALAQVVGAQSKVDVTGKWVFAVESAAGTGTPTVTFKQDGEKLSGHYSSQTLGEADFTGTVKGTAITFSFSVDAQGTALDVVYTGTIDGANAMKGKVVLGVLGEGTWTGKRQ